jgi:hypothetical protein
MLLAKKVDLVLTGDDHLYQRTHQLEVGPACPELVPKPGRGFRHPGRDGNSGPALGQVRPG